MNPQPSEQKRNFWGRMIWISAISIVLSICAGIAAYVIGMIRAFEKLRVAGAAVPAELAGDISTATLGPLVAIPIAFISLVLFIISITRHRKFSNPAQTST